VTREAIAWDVDPGDVDLTRPVVLVALAGLFDIGGSATGAITHLLERAASTTVRLARFDVDTFHDLRAHRPRAMLVGGVLTEVRFPEVVADAVTTGGRHDVVIVHGVEPTFRWQSFADGILGLAAAVDAEMVVTLGATPNMVPHTRPLPLVTSASSAHLARQLGLSLPSYQGPTGVAGVLQQRLGAGDVAGLSIRVSVPAYVAAEENPLGVQALLWRLGELFDIDTHAEDLAAKAASWSSGVDDAVADRPDVRATLSALERRHDEAAASVDLTKLVSDLERYLDS
jgi:proteasome assembly chaperone (PAC2) family protein